MSKQRNIGYIIFGICSVLAARVAVFEPEPGAQWDPLGIIHAVRYYIYGIGILGLLIVVEDVINEKLDQNQKTRDDSQNSE